ncbi:MAG TPA: DUF1800 domain-containing protein [Longimicrobium sp.]|nr:DUF1800 domain-containing protein [Longimicrobium sp.]
MRNPLPAAALRRRRLAAAGVMCGAMLLAALVPAGAAPRPALLHPVLARRAPAPPTQAPPTREDTARALHLLNRATFGARPRDIAEVLRMGPEAWLDRQLHPERIPDSAVEARLAAHPAARMSPGELYAAFPPPRQNPAAVARRDSLRRAREQAGDGSGMMSGGASPDEARPAAPRRRQRRLAAGDTAMAMRADGAGFTRANGARPALILADLAGAKLQRAVYGERQLEEVMTDFWFNHFNVFFGKNQDRYLVGAYEREAIRPHVFGRFRDLLEATAKHPAMLVYLDNAQSVVPDSMNPNAGRRDAALRQLRAMSPGQRAQLLRRRGVDPQLARRMAAGDTAVLARMRTRGINENYARELMELHTLGVDGGYTQHDVVEVARALTGWSVARGLRRGGGGGEPSFVFRAAAHDAGEKTVLGHRLPSGRGVEDGEEVLDILARHPATARHVAFQLAQRFVADQPPQALVDRLAQVFTRTDGDLREVTRALFLSPEFNDPRVRGAKVKSPLEFVASALRATGAEVGPSRMLLQTLRQMGQVPYAATAPTGYPSASEEWTNSGAMLSRMNFGLALAAGRLNGIRLDAAALASPGSSQEDAEVAALARAVLPGVHDARLLATVSEDLRAQTALAPEQRTARALGLLIGSPVFQKR